MALLRRGFLLICLLATSGLSAATATGTMQVVWPNGDLGYSESEVAQKAMGYLQSDDFHRTVAKLPGSWREMYCRSVGLNSSRNTNAITQAVADALTVQAEPGSGVITVTASNPLPDLALKLAQRACTVAANESRFRVAALESPKVKQLQSQMENIQDQIQQIKTQISFSKQATRAAERTGSQAASIGAPMGMGRGVDPAGFQNRGNQFAWNQQIEQLREQYETLNRELQQTVNDTWRGKKKVGLVVIDQADLDKN